MHADSGQIIAGAAGEAKLLLFDAAGGPAERSA
jgi:hypothetical protein